MVPSWILVFVLCPHYTYGLTLVSTIILLCIFWTEREHNATGEGSGGIDAHRLIVHSIMTRVTSSTRMAKRFFKESFGFMVQADLF